MFDEQAEREAVLLPRVGQGAAIKPGITRAQVARFFRRSGLARQAQIHRHNGTSLAAYIDSLVAEGYTLELYVTRYYMVKGEIAVWLRSSVAYDYAKMVLGRPGYERIY